MAEHSEPAKLRARERPNANEEVLTDGYDSGQDSEVNRSEDITRKLDSVPKKEIEARRKREAKKRV